MGRDKKAKKDKKGKKTAQRGYERRVCTSKATSLAKQGTRSLAQSDVTKTIGRLERALLKRFPADTAEAWDRTGLLVGDRSAQVKKVAVALDPTVEAIHQAADAGANVLITHHPAYLEAPDSFSPEPSVALSPGAGVWAAIAQSVALMCFHTALDVSKQAQVVLPRMLNLTYTGKPLVPLKVDPQLGYGQVCTVSTDAGKPESLSHLAARCTSVFGRSPRVWGNMDARIRHVVCATGSGSNVGKPALEAGMDCLICGELKYHDALDLSEAGLTIIEVGHDASEFPLTALLADAAVSFGMDAEKLIILDQSEQWGYPESIRI